MTDISGCSAHIKTDNMVKTIGLSSPYHANHTTGRTGEYRIFSLKIGCVGKTTIRLHKLQLRRRQGMTYLIDIMTQYR